MSAKKTPEELAEEYALKEFPIEDSDIEGAFVDIEEYPYEVRIEIRRNFLAGYQLGQANPTPEAIEKLMPSEDEFNKWGEQATEVSYHNGCVNGVKKPKGSDYSKWLLSELKRRAEGEKND